MEFIGLEDWMEIFAGGKQTDMSGKEHDGDVLIDKAIETFDPSFHEPPAVIGHPEIDDPAYGYVEGVKSIVRDGVKVLVAKFKQVVPEFADAVRQGLYKKRSAAFYPDGRLRHVGFLGAAPPAVKGLANIKFKDEDVPVVFEFGEMEFAKTKSYLNPDGTFKGGFDGCVRHFKSSEGLSGESARKLCAYIGRRAGKIHSDDLMNEIAEFIKFNEIFQPRKEKTMNAFKERVKGILSIIGIDTSKVPDDALPDDIPNNLKSTAFTEADIDKARKEGEEAGKKEVEKTFAEKNAASAKTTRDKEIADFVDGLIKDGKVPPSWKDAGIVAFMQHLGADEELVFSEGKNATTSLEWFKSFLSGFGKQDLFSEMATKEKAGDSAEFAEAKKDEELGKSIAAKVNPKKQ